MFQFSVYFHAILIMICFSSACISVLSSPYAVSVQHVFSCYPFQAMFEFSMYFGALLMMCSACISMLSSPSAVFQFSVYFRTILSKLCFSLACILVLSL